MKKGKHRAHPPERAPKAKPPKRPVSTPPPSSRSAGAEAPDSDASARLVAAEGADRPPERRPRPRKAAPPRPKKPPTLHATVEVPAQVPPDVPSDPAVADRIRELEERLDRMIVERTRERDTTFERTRERDGAPAIHDTEPPTAGPPTSRSTIPPPEPDGVLDTARELLSTDYYLRKWGRIGLRSRSEEVDEFGYDPAYEQKVLPFFDLLYEKYFRVEAHGVHGVPSDGRCLLVANHSGTLPWDGMMLRMAVRREHPRHRDVRWLAEDVIFHFPFLGSFSNRVGAVRACQENAERLLDQGALVAVFPEGMKGIGKLYRERYRLQRFGRGGFIKLCLRTRTPVVPVAIVGGEETNPMLTRIEYLTKALGLPYFPVTPTFPLLGPLGLLPAPTKWKIFFGEPLDLEAHGAESADDEILVGKLTERVRTAIQSMLDRALSERRSVWFG
jgi:1-acyl-sn-glycerol-3-phosphate acyltransferase